MKINTSTILATVSFGLLLAANGQVITPTDWKQSNAFNNLRLASNLENATGMDAGQTILYNLDGSPSGEPNTANNISWVTTSKVTAPATLATEISAGKVWIVADLGASYDLTSIRIWNFNWDNTPGSPTTSLNNRGVNQFDILVRNTAADTDDGSAEGTPINLTSISDATGAISNSVPFNPGTTNPWTVALENQTLTEAPNNDSYGGQSYFIPSGNTARFIAIRVDSYHGGAGVALGKVRFIVDNSPPTLAIKSPADDATGVAANSNLVATFSKQIQAGASGNVTIRKTSDNTVVEAFAVASSLQLTFSSAQLTINPTANLLPGTDYYVQIDAGAVKDTSGGFYAGIVAPDTTSWSFTTDNTAPLLASTVPLDDATDVATVSNLVAVLNEPIQTGTGNITIRKTVGDSLVESFNVATSAQLTIANAQLTINPSSDLEIGTQYYVQIDAGAVQDVSGNPYLGIVSPDTTTWSFTTDNTAPTLTGLSPSAPTKADPGTRLLAQFDEPVQAGTGSVTIHKVSDNSVVETINVTTPGAVANIGGVIAVVRSVALDPETAYYVNAPAAAFEDISGNPAAAITGTTAWTFTTSSAVPLVLEHFNGSNSPLSGTSADIFSAPITTAGGSAVWGTGAGFLENGAFGAAASSQAFLSLGSYINDTKGTPAGRFELTMTLSENDLSWVSLGFVGTNTPSTTGNFTTSSGLGTVIYRGQTGIVAAPNVNGEIDMFAGPNNTNGVDEGAVPYTGFRTLTVDLDLTGHDGTSNFGTVTWSDSVLGNLGSHSFTANRNFNSILITQAASNGTINGLALYQTGSAGDTFANWIGGFSVGGLTGVDDDFDNDSLGNALENLLGTSPEVFSRGLATVSSSGGNLVFRHTLGAAPASDLTGAYEWSTNLVTWNASGTASGGTTVTFGAPVVITPGTPDLVEVTATVTGTPASRVFTRFKATQN